MRARRVAGKRRDPHLDGAGGSTDMSHNPHVKELERTRFPSDLARRQEALRAEIRQRRQRVLGLVIELRRLDEAIRRAGPVPDDVRLTRDAVGEAGGISQLVIEAFADAPRLLTSRDIARRIAMRLGLDAGNRAVINYMTQRVCTGLWTLQQSGAVSKTIKPRGSLQLWSLGELKA